MGKVLFAEQDGVHILKFLGDVRLNLGPTISDFQQRLCQLKRVKAVVIDLSEVSGIDSTALGFIAKISIATREIFNSTTSIIAPNPDISRILESMAMEQVCVISPEPLKEDSNLIELPELNCTEEELREQVLAAHRALMTINAGNREKFQDLVDALENEKELVPVAKAC